MKEEQFRDYLTTEKKAAHNTANAYVRDVKHFEEFLSLRGTDSLCGAINADVIAYLLELKNQDRRKSTINRKLASIRTYYGFLQKCHEISDNAVMDLPDNSEKGIRDRAMLELLYATGIRAGELIDMDMADLNLRMGFVTCAGENIRARIIPIGRMARNALEKYIEASRPLLTRHNPDEKHLFVNFQGKPITRQGLWKILKEYGEAAGLPVNLTPQVIRNSFAIHMLQNGADIKSLQELMGHEDISATQAYLAYTKNRIKDVYDKAHPRA